MFTSAFLLSKIIIPLYFKNVLLCVDLVFALQLAFSVHTFVFASASEKPKNISIKLVPYESYLFRKLAFLATVMTVMDIKCYST